VRDGNRVLEIITERYGFVIATVEPDDPEMRATAEIMAQSWTRYQREQPDPTCTCPGTFYPERGCHISGCPASNV
jgi:hypothetical protein